MAHIYSAFLTPVYMSHIHRPPYECPIQSQNSLRFYILFCKHYVTTDAKCTEQTLTVKELMFFPGSPGLIWIKGPWKGCCFAE